MDDLDHLDHSGPSYHDDDHYYHHRPLKSHHISSEYPYKPHRYGKMSRFEPNHYIDYELSSKSEPGESMKHMKDSLVQESSDKVPQLNLHNQ